jgi:hypothetical protein
VFLYLVLLAQLDLVHVVQNVMLNFFFLYARFLEALDLVVVVDKVLDD